MQTFSEDRKSGRQDVSQGVPHENAHDPVHLPERNWHSAHDNNQGRYRKIAENPRPCLPCRYGDELKWRLPGWKPTTDFEHDLDPACSNVGVNAAMPTSRSNPDEVK